MPECHGTKVDGTPCRSTYVRVTNHKEGVRGYYCDHHHRQGCCGCDYCGRSQPHPVHQVAKVATSNSVSLSDAREKVDGVEEIVQVSDAIILRMYVCQSLEAVLWMAGKLLEQLNDCSFSADKSGDLSAIVKKRFPFLSDMSSQFHKLTNLLKLVVKIMRSTSLGQARIQIRDAAPACEVKPTSTEDIFTVCANEYEHITGNFPNVTISNFEELEHYTNQYIPRIPAGITYHSSPIQICYGATPMVL